MNLNTLLSEVADALEAFDAEKPIHKAYRAGIGPFGEPQLVRELARRLTSSELQARTRRTPDLSIGEDWAIEFKIVRPFGDNGREAENWSVNMLHPYPGHASLISDAMKLARTEGYHGRVLVVIGYEHQPAKISLDPLLRAFELIASGVAGFELGERLEERRGILVHPVHQVLRCVAWELIA